jgi:cytochrome c biogenesis protein CcmG/thiol:disulfide interchange protein DsbE
MRLINSTPFLVFMAVIIALYYSLNPDSSEDSKKLSTLELSLASGETLDLNQFHGQFYVIHLFASWCSVCKEDAPYLKMLSNHGKVPIIGIAVRDKLAKVRLLNKNNLAYDYIAIDSNMEVAKLLRGKAIPETLIINPEGKIIFRYVGGLNQALVQEHIMPKLQ